MSLLDDCAAIIGSYQVEAYLEVEETDGYTLRIAHRALGILEVSAETEQELIDKLPAVAMDIAKRVAAITMAEIDAMAPEKRDLVHAYGYGRCRKGWGAGLSDAQIERINADRRI